ncbi:MAG: hypothetical protein GX542_11820 [Rhodococcus sp.]|nr:hypothetical protein [Rhodococcus sp. (in: high G+C Gram-positive bacteria)]
MLAWKLYPEQFLAFWELTDHDAPPYPIKAIGRHDDSQLLIQERAQLRRELQADNNDITIAMRVLANPEVYVEITGTVQDTNVRIAAGVLTDRIAIASEIVHDGHNVVALGLAGTRGLSQRLVGAIPANAGGTRTFAPVSAAPSIDVGGEPDSYMTSVWGDDRPAAGFADACAASGVGGGSVEVFRGPRLGREHKVGRVGWVDLGGDGRYISGPYNVGTINSGGPEAFTTAVQTLIAEALEEHRSEAYA